MSGKKPYNLIIVSVLICIVIVSLLIIVFRPTGERFTALWVDPNTYPRFARSGEIIEIPIGMVNYEGSPKIYRLQVLLEEEIIYEDNIPLVTSQTLEKNITVTLPEIDDYPKILTIKLLNNGQELHFTLNNRTTEIYLEPTISLLQSEGEKRMYLISLDFLLRNQERTDDHYNVSVVYDSTEVWEWDGYLLSGDNVTEEINFIIDEIFPSILIQFNKTDYQKSLEMDLFESNFTVIDIRSEKTEDMFFEDSMKDVLEISLVVGVKNPEMLEMNTFYLYNQEFNLTKTLSTSLTSAYEMILNFFVPYEGTHQNFTLELDGYEETWNVSVGNQYYIFEMDSIITGLFFKKAEITTSIFNHELQDENYTLVFSYPWGQAYNKTKTLANNIYWNETFSFLYFGQLNVTLLEKGETRII